MGGFFQELKRRKVFRVAAAYAVVAWLLIQVADVVLPTFGTPEWVNQTVIFVFVIGFPVALVLAWAFEISADGLKRESPQPESDAGLSLTDKSPDLTQPSDKSANLGPQVFIYSFIGLFAGAVSMYIFLGVRTPSSMNTSSSTPFALRNWTTSIVYPTPTFEVSPDGSKIVYLDNEINMLRLQYTDSIEHRLLEGTEGAVNPFFSPDSESIGFFVDGTLQRIPLAGSQPIFVANIGLQVPMGATWLENNQIVWGTVSAGLYGVPASGGNASVVKELASEYRRYAFPSSVKGRSELLFHKELTGVSPQVWLLDLETGEERYLFDGMKPSYVSSGHVIYANGSGYILAASVNFDRLIENTDHNLIVGEVATGGMAYSVADSDVLVYFRTPDNTETSLILQEPGQPPQVIDRGFFTDPVFSNNDQYIAVTSVTRTGSDVYRYDIAQDSFSLIAENARIPLWSPGDDSITFFRPGVGLVTKKLGAEDSAEEIFIEHSDNIFPNEWIDGGNTFVYNALFPDTASDLLARHNDGTSTVLMRDESDTWASSFTSDEEWVAYVYDNSVYVSKYPDFSIRWLVSSGMFPRWGNGQSLYFMNGANLSAVDVTFTPSVSFSNPYHVAELGITGFLTKRFDVDDSGRIVYTKVANTPQSPVLVRNFLAEIE